MKKSLIVTILVLIVIAICGFVFVSSLAEAADPSKPEKKDGKCGPAAKTYSVEESGYAGAFCSVGSQQGFSSFPPPGRSSSWTCSGMNGGNPSSTCTATRTKKTKADHDKELEEALRRTRAVIGKDGIEVPEPPKIPPPKKDQGWKLDSHGPFTTGDKKIDGGGWQWSGRW